MHYTFISGFFHWNLCLQDLFLLLHSRYNLFILIIVFLVSHNLFTHCTVGRHFWWVQFLSAMNGYFIMNILVYLWMNIYKHFCWAYTEECNFWTLGCPYVYLWYILQINFPKWFYQFTFPLAVHKVLASTSLPNLGIFCHFPFSHVMECMWYCVIGLI